MGVRSKVHSLPEAIKAELDRRLVAGGFAGYADLAEWLAAQGHGISASSVHRYGQDFEQRLATLRVAAEQAKAITEGMGDDAGALGEALTAVAQERAFGVLMEMTVEDAQAVSFDKLVTSIAKLNSAGVQQKKWAADVRARAAAAAAEVDDAVRAAGVSDEVAEDIRKKILGIGS